MTENNIQMYLNQEAVQKARSSGLRRAVIGGILLFLFLSGSVRMFMEIGTAAFSDANNIAGTMVVLMVILLILTPLYLLFRNGLRKRIYAGRAARYAEVFAAEESGYLLLSDIAWKLHIPEERVLRDIKALLRRE